MKGNDAAALMQSQINPSRSYGLNRRQTYGRKDNNDGGGELSNSVYNISENSKSVHSLVSSFKEK